MKIAFDAQSLFEEKKTGIGWTVEKLIEHIELQEENEYELNYFSFKDKRNKRKILEKYVKRGFKLRECGCFPLGIYRRIWNIIPISYSCLLKSNAHITQFFNYVIPPGVKGKKAVYIYDMVYRAFPETMEASNRKLLEKEMKHSCDVADCIITISEFSKLEIIKHLGIEDKRIFVVPCGVDLEVFKPEIDNELINITKKTYEIDGEYFLYLGTLEPRKNIMTILKAYQLLKFNQITEVPKLVIAGKKGWEYENLFVAVLEMSIKDDVIFTDYIDEKDKALLLKGAECFLFPSLYEGFGLPPLEAMACGTPVIVSNRASMPEVVGNAGIMIEPYDFESMEYYMRKLSTNRKFREQIVALGKEQAMKYSWKASSERLLDVYRTLA